MALNVVQYEEILSLLRQVPHLVDELEARHTDFASEVLAWLKLAECALDNNHLPAVSQVASCRATLIEATRGVHTKELAFIGRPTSRKIKEAAAGMVLDRCSDLLNSVIADRQAVFREAERLSAQVLAVASAKGLIEACGSGRPHQEFLRCLGRQVAVDPDLASAHVALVALVGNTDVLIFLDRGLAALA